MSNYERIQMTFKVLSLSMKTEIVKDFLTLSLFSCAGTVKELIYKSYVW